MSQEIEYHYRISERQAAIINSIVATRLRIRTTVAKNLDKPGIQELMQMGNELNSLLDSLDTVHDRKCLGDYMPFAG